MDARAMICRQDLLLSVLYSRSSAAFLDGQVRLWIRLTSSQTRLTLNTIGHAQKPRTHGEGWRDRDERKRKTRA